MSGFIIYSLASGNHTTHLSFLKDANQALINLQRVMPVGYEITFKKLKAQPIDSKPEVVKCLNDESFPAITLSILEQEKFMGLAQHHSHSARQTALESLKAAGFNWLDELPDI
jgi:hypothetical protein